MVTFTGILFLAVLIFAPEQKPIGLPEADPERSRLFDYQPYGDGVVYTELPADGEWSLTWLPDIQGGGAPRMISLAGIAVENGAPTILYVPRNGSS